MGVTWLSVGMRPLRRYVNEEVVEEVVTCSTSLSRSPCPGKWLRTISATRSLMSTLGVAPPSPSAGGEGEGGAGDTRSRTSLSRSATPPEPARISQGMEVFRDSSTRWSGEG